MSDPANAHRRGPLAGVRVLEFDSVGPAPFAGMLLSGLGADVIRVHRPTASTPEKIHSHRALDRDRRSIVVDLKHPEAPATVLQILGSVDALLEGLRPGVMERLGLGPEAALARNPRLVYARLTGWGQDGPYSRGAGHDINFIAVASALAPLAHDFDLPVPPLNLLGDFGGGGMLGAIGVLAALLRVAQGGDGQVVDASIVEGTALLTAMLHSTRAAGMWSEQQAENALAGRAPYYRTYRCKDGRDVAVGALEPAFYEALLAGLDLGAEYRRNRTDPNEWDRISEAISRRFAGAPRQVWLDRFHGTDACVSPVVEPGDVANDPHLAWRRVFVAVGESLQPAPAPRFSTEVLHAPQPPASPGSNSREVLTEAGFTETQMEGLLARGVIRER